MNFATSYPQSLKMGQDIVSLFKKIATCCVLLLSAACYGEVITPHKYLDKVPGYNIPKNARYVIDREVSVDAPEIVYYYSQPEKDTFPIALLCGGSSDESNISSIIHHVRKRPDIINNSFKWLEKCLEMDLHENK